MTNEINKDGTAWAGALVYVKAKSSDDALDAVDDGVKVDGNYIEVMKTDDDNNPDGNVCFYRVKMHHQHHAIVILMTPIETDQAQLRQKLIAAAQRMQ